MLNFIDLSWSGIVVAAAASFIVGGLWFTVFLGRTYSAALGREHDPAAKPALPMILGPAAWSLITAFVTAVLMASLGTETVTGALFLGLFIGLGYLASTTINTGINPNIPNPLLYGVISGSYHLVATVIIAMTLALF